MNCLIQNLSLSLSQNIINIIILLLFFNFFFQNCDLDIWLNEVYFQNRLILRLENTLFSAKKIFNEEQNSKLKNILNVEDTDQNSVFKID